MVKTNKIHRLTNPLIKTKMKVKATKITSSTMISRQRIQRITTTIARSNRRLKLRAKLHPAKEHRKDH